MKNLINNLQLKFEITRVFNAGFYYIFIKLISKFGILIFSLILIPISVVLHFLGYRVANIFTNRIGHLAIEPDCIIREVKLRRISINPKNIFFFLPRAIAQTII